MSYEGRIRHIDSAIPLCPHCGGPTEEARAMEKRRVELERQDIALRALNKVMEVKGLEEAAALVYLREREPDLATWAEAGLARQG